MSTESKYKIFGVRTTVGQERNVVRMITNRLDENSEDIASVFILPSIRGYVFVEAKDKDRVVMLIQGIMHIKSKPIAAVQLEDLERHIIEKPVIETIETGTTVEVIAGPLKGVTGRIVRVDKLKKEVTIELIESRYPLPISVPVSYVRPITK